MKKDQPLRHYRLITRRPLAYAIACGLIIHAGSSVAQSAVSNDDNAFELEEIIVTATKRDTSLQETSMSISVLTEETLTNRGITTPQDFYTTVPGISASDTSPGENNISIRGVATDIFTSGASSISTYLDEFPIVRGARDIRLIDVQRVEVLKGPQGTLYGQAAIAGVIRYISNQPTTEAMSGSLTSSVSNTKHGGTNYNMYGHFNLPITDNLAARAVLYRYDNDGFIDIKGRFPEDNGNTEETVGGRLAIKWDITDDLTFDLVYLNQEIDLGSTNFVTDTLDPSIGISSLMLADFDNPKAQYVRRILREDEMLNVKLNARFDAFDLTLMGGHKELRDDGEVDVGAFLRLIDASAISFNDARSDVNTWELRLVSNDADNARFSWLAGVWYEDFEHHSDRGNVHNGPDATVFGMSVFDGFVYSDVLEDNLNEELSFYGEFAIHFSEQTTLTLGARRADVEVERKVLSASGPLAAATGRLIGVDTNVQEDVTTYRINLKHQLNEDIMFYAQAASGYRAGGFNAANVAAGVPPSAYESDNLWNYELGARSTWLDGRLVANATLYRIDWDDMQLRARQRSPSGVFFSILDNVGKAKVDGVEIEVDYQITDALKLGMNYAHTDPRLAEDYVQANGAVVPDGTDLPNTAKNTYTLFAQYQQPLTSELDLQVYLTHRYIDNRLSAFGTGDLAFKPFEFPELEITDLRIGVNHHNGLTATLFANNLFNEVKPTFKSESPLFASYRINQPRTLGVTLGYSF